MKVRLLELVIEAAWRFEKCLRWSCDWSRAAEVSVKLELMQLPG